MTYVILKRFWNQLICRAILWTSKWRLFFVILYISQYNFFLFTLLLSQQCCARTVVFFTTFFGQGLLESSDLPHLNYNFSYLQALLRVRHHRKECDILILVLTSPYTKKWSKFVELLIWFQSCVVQWSILLAVVMPLVYTHFKTAPQRKRDFIVLSINSVKF